MKSSNCSLTFSGRAGALPRLAVRVEGPDPNAQRLYGLTLAGFREELTCPGCCLVGPVKFLTPPGAGCSETQSASLRCGWDAQSQG